MWDLPVALIFGGLRGNMRCGPPRARAPARAARKEARETPPRDKSPSPAPHLTIQGRRVKEFNHWASGIAYGLELRFRDSGFGDSRLGFRV